MYPAAILCLDVKANFISKIGLCVLVAVAVAVEPLFSLPFLHKSQHKNWYHQWLVTPGYRCHPCNGSQIQSASNIDKLN